jgi:Flp pilus assembly protein TadG
MSAHLTNLRRRLARRRSGRLARGQSLVELAVCLPLILVFGLACIQFAIIFTAYLNVMNTTRDAARWVSVHPHVVDTGTGSTDATIRSRLPAGISSAALTMTFTPACSSLTSGRCASRPNGATITVASTYNISSHLFLPTSFGFSGMVVQIPTTLPVYSINMQVEPI